jgi:hypothetical protein
MAMVGDHVGAKGSQRGWWGQARAFIQPFMRTDQDPMRNTLILFKGMTPLTKVPPSMPYLLKVHTMAQHHHPRDQAPNT